MKGRVTPVSGIVRVTPPMITKAWIAKTAVKPVVSSFENPSSASRAILKPRAAIRR